MLSNDHNFAQFIKRTHFIAVEQHMARWKENSTKYFISWLPFSVCEPIKMENFIEKQ